MNLFPQPRGLRLAGFALAAIAFLLAACPQRLDVSYPAGEGARITIHAAGKQGRTLFPASSSLTYTAVFETEGQHIEKTLGASGSGNFTLSPGFWNISVTAQAGGVAVAAASVVNIELKNGETTELNLTLIPLSGVAAGNLEYALNFPNGVKRATLSIEGVDGVPASSSPFTVLNQKNGTINLAAGSWLLRLNLEYGKAKVPTGVAEAFHIYPGQNTRASYTFTVADFPLFLSADTSLDAYTLVSSKGYGYETPDQSGGGHTGTPHITQQYDAALGRDVFAFQMHYNAFIKDGNATGDQTRQRIEIKVDDDDYQGKEGRSFVYRWKFKLPADFAPSTDFTHIHQIKNESGDSSAPIITLTPRLVSGNKRMQLIYRAPTYNYGEASSSDSSNQNLKNDSSSLNDFLGEWVQAEETITYSANPDAAAYSIIITRIRDNKILMSYTHSAAAYAELESDAAKWPFVTWRSTNTYGRPKYGLYRLIWKDAGLTNPVAGIKDETILYADFELERKN